MIRALVLGLLLTGCATLAPASLPEAEKQKWEEADEKIVAAIVGMALYLEKLQAKGMLPKVEELEK